MKYQLSTHGTKADYIVLLIQTPEELNKHQKYLPQANITTLTELNKAGGAMVVPNKKNAPFKASLIINVGKNYQKELRSFRKHLLGGLKLIKSGSVAIEANETTLQAIVEQCHQAFYQFNEFKSKPNKAKINKITLLCKDKKPLTALLKKSCAIVNAMSLSKKLGYTPSNICTPTFLLKQAKELAKQYPSIKVSSINETQMQKLGMGAIYAVSKGSKEPGYIVTMEYHGTKKSEQPIALVGKGVTFDTGGNNIKAPVGMFIMKYDMGGAGTVMALMQAIAEMKLPINVVGVMACVENMLDGGSYKPSDIVTSMSGKTIEIINTDAEGRLALCDALTYIEKYNPKTVIDMATLTGAAIVSLGYHATALFSNDQSLADELLEAGKNSHDRAWQMPLWDEYKAALRSPFADVLQSGTPIASCITAACFLSEFTKKYRWAHLDISGSYNFPDGRHQKVTGRPVPMMVEYLLRQV